MAQTGQLSHLILEPGGGSGLRDRVQYSSWPLPTGQCQPSSSSFPPLLSTPKPSELWAREGFQCLLLQACPTPLRLLCSP